MNTVANAKSTAILADKGQVRDSKERELGSQMTSLGAPSKPVVSSTIQTKMNPVKEKLIQTIALMEYQAKEALQHHENNSPATDVFGELPDLKEHMQYIELLKTLQTELDTQEKKIRRLEFRVSTEGTNAELLKVMKEVESLKEQLIALEKEKIAVEGDKRVEHNKLIEAKRMCEFLQTRVANITDEKKELENELTIKINKLTFQLTNAKSISEFLEQKLKETKKQKEEAVTEGAKVEANLKFQLTNAKTISDFVRSKLKESQDKVKELEAKICKLDFSLTNSQSIGKFMEGKLSDTQNENKSLKEQVAQLEAEISSLKVRLALKNDLIERKDHQFKEQVATTEQVQKEVLKYKGKLNASNKMTAFLQSQLADAEEMQFSSFSMTAPGPSHEEVKSLKASLEQYQKKCESLQNKLVLVEDEKWVAEARIRELNVKLQAAESKLENSKQSKSLDNTAELQAQVRELRQQLKAAQDATKSAESHATQLQGQPVGGDAHSALLDLEFRLTQSEVANKALKNEMAAIRQQKEEAEGKLEELERRSSRNY